MNFLPLNPSKQLKILDFSITKNDSFRFEMPELNNVEKMSGKVVSNLLYYQTNYFVSFLAIFLLVFFFVPWKMLYIIILLGLGNQSLLQLVLYIRHFSFWSSTLHVSTPCSCESLEEESPHSCHDCYLLHRQVLCLPVWMVLLLLLEHFPATSADCHSCFSPRQGQGTTLSETISH